MTRLQAIVDKRLLNTKDSRWHYESRIKGLDSFTLKVESGRITHIDQLEDFFACTLVVINATQLAAAEELVVREFDLVERRPKNPSITHKEPEAFPFDDLRLYVKWRDDPTLPPTGLEDLCFEVQVKTFLQHAWAIATHDLIYKTAKPDWPKERIAFQIKAMLEHAELSIANAETLAETTGTRLTSEDSERLAEMVQVLVDMWERENLPEDLRRLAKNILAICTAINIAPAELRALLAEEASSHRGPAIKNLSPYGTVIDVLLRRQQAKMLRLLQKKPNRHLPRVLLCPELELPASATVEDLRNAVVIRESRAL